MSISICPGTLQTVLSAMGVASGYCTLTLFLLQKGQVCCPLWPHVEPSLPLRWVVIYLSSDSFISCENRKGDLRCFVRNVGHPQAPYVDISGLRSKNLECFSMTFPSFLSGSVSLGCPGFLLLPCMGAGTQKLSCFQWQGRHRRPKGALTLQTCTQECLGGGEQAAFY